MLPEVTDMLASTLRFGTPLIFAALAGLLSERVGIINIGLEGMLLVGAFFAVVGSSITGNAWLGVALACVASAVAAAIHAVATIRFNADQIISGVAINLLALGLTGYLLVQIFGAPGSTPQVAGFGNSPIPVLSELPVIGPALFGQSWFIWAAPLAAIAVWFFLSRTTAGLRVRASGEAPTVLEVAGVSVVPVRMVTVIVSGVLCGLGGAFLSLGLLTSFSENMTAGRGFIALAAVIFGGWRPLPVLAAAIFFGFADALVIRLPQDILDPQLLHLIPYVATILALVLFARGARGPASAGVPYLPRSARRD